MKNKHNSIDDYLKLSVIGGIIIVVVSIAYYFVIFIPQKESQKVELQKEELRISQQREQEKTTALKNCLLQADFNATAYWNKQCKNFGVDKNGNPDLKDDCSLGKYHADAVNTAKRNEQDQCYQLYK